MSSRNRRKAEGDGRRSTLNTKRRCSPSRLLPVQQTECILWPETEESFFSNSKLEAALSAEQQMDSNAAVETITPPLRLSASQQSNHFHENNADDSLFSVIQFPEKSEARKNEITVEATKWNDTLFAEVEPLHSTNASTEKTNLGPTPLPQIIPQTTYLNDTLFAEIDLEDLSNKATDNIFEKATSPITIQNSQQFLNDIKQNINEHNVTSRGNMDSSIISKSIIDSIIQGTQYETHAEIQNRTIQNMNQTNAVFEAKDVHAVNLSQLNWETQAFVQEDTFPSKGDFYGLPDRVKRLIFEHKGIKSLYEWQDECLNLPAIRKRTNLIYALPTSGGKTLVAEILMLRELLCREKNVLFILPYVSIVQEKVSAMAPFAIALDFLVDEYTAGKGKCPPVKRHKRKSIFVASIEKGAVLFDSLIEADRANEIGLVVVDELHLIGERGRGATLEALLTKVLFLNANIQIVGMSATIGNLSEISAFLKADVYTRGFRPVELKEYIKCDREILEVNMSGKSLEEVFVYKRTVNFNYSDAVARADPDHLAGLVTECAPENNCLIFCPSRKNCENVALLLSRILPKSKFRSHRESEKLALMDGLEKVCGVLSPVLAKTIPFGIAYHHSGLTTDERKFIETAYRFGALSVICCTSTLAAGVNLPAKRVIIRAPYVGADFMTLCKYKQMVGRAGRAGMGDAGESILISASRDNVRVGEMLFSPMDRALSSLDFQEHVGLQGLIMSAIGLGIAACRRDLYRLVNSTLLAVQAEQLGISTEQLVLDIVRDMFKNKVLQLSNKNSTRDAADIITTQDVHAQSMRQHDKRLFIGTSTPFQLTTIGRAAYKSGIDYKRTFAIYNELKSAQQQLILSNYAHLLYLIVAFNSKANGDELFTADPAILFRLYNELDATTQQLFRQLGITEAHAARLGKTHSIHGAMELKFNRLFKVLVMLDILLIQPLPAVSAKYNIERGMLQNLISQCTAAASALVRLCEEIDEFWCFKPLFERISAKMDRCGSVELEPLLELPAVKINRAKQLYCAGFRTIEDIARCRPMTLVKSVEHMPLKVAKEIISAAKIILMKKLDHLEEETEALKDCLKQSKETQ